MPVTKAVEISPSGCSACVHGELPELSFEELASQKDGPFHGFVEAALTNEHDSFERIQQKFESMHVTIHTDVGTVEIEYLESGG